MKARFLRQLFMAIAILGGMGLAFFVSNHVSNGVPKYVSSEKLKPYSPPKPEGREAEEWLFYKSAYPNKSLPPGAQEKAWRQSMKARAPQSGSLDGSSTDDHWTSIGPAPIISGQIEGPVVADPNPKVSGRILDIAVDPTDASTVANHWFIAADTGGVWETTNAGSTWTPKTDGELSLAMSTITIAPSNPQTLFATNRDTSGSILKSTDGGASWEIEYSFPNSGWFNYAALEVHPTNPKIVLAMTWYLFDENSCGLFKSPDGGSTFEQKLAGPGTALEINPQDFDQQYAAIRGGDNATSSYNGVYRSFDEGETWTYIDGPWGSIPAGAGVRIAIAPSNPDTLYVVVPGSGIWRTDDAWAKESSWTALPDCGFTFIETIIVDPTDPTIYYVGAGGGNAFFRVTGESCTTCPSCEGNRVSIQSGNHVDQHRLKAAGSDILIGNDGGLWSSPNRGTSWYNKNSNLGTIQFYAGSLHPTRGNWVLGGSQDNGSEISTGNAAWDFIWLGDGGFSAFAAAGSDPDHNWLVSHSSLNIYKVVVTGGPPYIQYLYQAMTGIDNTGAAFIAPIRRSPNSNVVLAGADNLFKSTDFFTATNPTWTANGPEMGAEIGTVAFAPSDTSSLTYAFGAGNGELRLTTVGGDDAQVAEPWKDLDPGGDVPNRYVEAIAFKPTDAATIYVALNGYGTGHIFKTTNAMADHPGWDDVSPSADVPINALAIDPAHPDTIYAGANIGIWKSTDGGDSWTFMGPESGMPNVPVYELLFSPADGLLVALTHGRGAFKLNAGSLQVFITPLGATMAGAKWNVDGGPFQTTGTVLPGLAPGNHTVTFSSVSGYVTPANQTVSITANETTQATGVYTSQ